MTLLIDLLMRMSVVLAAGLLLSACCTRRSAALRHRVLAGSVLGAALVLPLSLALPDWSLRFPAHPFNTAPASTSTVPAEALSSEAAVPAPSRTPHPGAPSRTPTHPDAPQPMSPLVMVWLAGVGGFAGLLFVGLARVRRAAAGAERVTDEAWLRALEIIARRYGLKRDVSIARTDRVNLLATWGILRPQVLLPRHSRDWPLDRIHVVLSHELAHIRRHDWLVQMGAEVVRAVLWFNPLAWMVCTRLRRESEQACDDEVLGSGVGGRDYAAHLLELARQCRRPGSTWAPVLPMAHPSTLERRIAAMLNPRLDRQAPSGRALAALAVILLIITLPVAAVRAGQAAPAPLTGTVYDVSGAVLPGVELSLTDASKVTLTTISAANGRFEFPSVAPGTYVLAAQLAGFRSLRREVELRQAGDWDRAIMLQVGGLIESISVRATRVAPPPRKVPGFAPQAPVRVGGNIRAPKKIRDVRPTYPPSMREAGRTGVVILEAGIDTDGLVSSVRVLSAQAHPDLAVAAVDAVRQWRFTPTLLNGVAVEVVMTVTVQFDLEG